MGPARGLAAWASTAGITSRNQEKPRSRQRETSPSEVISPGWRARSMWRLTACRSRAKALASPFGQSSTWASRGARASTATTSIWFWLWFWLCRLLLSVCSAIARASKLFLFAFFSAPRFPAFERLPEVSSYLAISAASLRWVSLPRDLVKNGRTTSLTASHSAGVQRAKRDRFASAAGSEPPARHMPMSSSR